MKSKIYLITNKSNNKTYVGKTYLNIDSRFNQHCSKAKNGSNLPLHRALRKYGRDNFSVKLLDIVEESSSAGTEKYYIQELKSYTKGYNATLGGDGRSYHEVDIEKLIADYTYLETSTLAAEAHGISSSYARKLLKANDIILRGSRPDCRKRVFCESLNKTFGSLKECAEYLINEQIAKGTVKSVCSSLTKACTGSRKTYKKLTFKYT